jgi:hypothetical protein
MPGKNQIEFLIVGRDAASKAFAAASASVAAAGRAVVSASKIMATATAAGAAGLLKISHSAADAQDKVQKLSDRLGIGVTALSQFHHHAELSGLRTQTFDMALQRMSRRVAEAAQETGEAQSAIKELGLDAKVLAGLPLDQQMLRVADAIQGVEDPATKTRLAFKLFDSEGVAMIQTMKEGSDGFRQSAADLDRLGQTMNAQGTANAAKFKDEWLRLQKAVGGVTKGIADEFIPIFSGVFKRISDLVANNRERIVSFVVAAVEGFIRMGLILRQVMSQSAEFITRLFNPDTAFDALNDIASAAKNMLVNIVGFAKQAGPAIAATLVASFRAAFTIAQEVAKTAWMNIFDLITGKNIADSFGDAIKRGVLLAQQDIATVEVAFGDLATTVSSSAKSISDGVADTFKLNMDSINEQVQASIQGLMTLGQVSQEQRANEETAVVDYTQRVRDMYDQFSMSQMEMAESYASALKSTLDTAISGIGNGIADIIVDGKSAVDVFRNIAKTVVKQLIASYIQMKISRLLFAKTDGAASIAMTYANTFMSWAGAPWPISMLAPAMATTNAAQVGAAVATGLAGAAHGGMDYVPSESTYLLNRGERVLSPRQNQDLTTFLDGNTGATGDITVNVFTTANNFDGISEADVREFVAGKIIPAMDRLDRQGVRPAAIERAIT